MFKNLKTFLILNSEKGQALLIVVLVMLVGLTVGLAVVSRSVTTLRNATDEANSERAFSAAEAGIERALRTGTGISVAEDLGDNAKIENVAVQTLSGTEFLINGGDPVSKDDGVDIWLVEHNPDGTLNYSGDWQDSSNRHLSIYWGLGSTSLADRCTNAAVEIIAITKDGTNVKSKRYAVDPCSTRNPPNNFSSDNNSPAGPYQIAGKSFPFRYTIGVQKGVVVRVIPIYLSSPLAVRGCNEPPSDTSCTALPNQGQRIESTGRSGETLRKVVYYQIWPKLPSEFFQYILFSPSSL